MLHISNAQRARNAPHRQSVLEFAQGDGSTRNWSDRGSTSASTFSYNYAFLHDYLKCHKRTLPDDVHKLRREVQDEYYKETSVDRKRQCLTDAVALLDVLKLQTTQIPQDDDPNLPFFLSEYQAFVYWVYSTIRFSNFMGELNRHFADLKEHHRAILSSVRTCHEHFLPTVVRFSFLCLEFADLCDDEALHWCRRACSRHSHRRNSPRSCSSLSSASACSVVAESGEELQARRDADYEAQLVRDLRNNVQEIELAITLSLAANSSSGEKLVS